MKLTARLFLSLCIIIGVVFYFYFDFIRDDIVKRYKEAVEETLNDTANVLSSLIEIELEKNNKFNFINVKKIFETSKNKKLNSKIYNLSKNKVDLAIYVVDNNGKVIFDSENKVLGEDYSQWNDVYLTLKGKYGARSTQSDSKNPESDALYVAAPIYYKNKIYGAVTVVKPKTNINQFTSMTKRKIFIASIIALSALFVLLIVMSYWITRPTNKLLNYVRSLKTANRKKFPKLGFTEIKELGIAFEEIKEELEGKKYIENYIQTLAHEIKSPLSSIIGASELLEEKMPEAQKKKFYKNIKNESLRIEKLIEKLLELSSVESRKELKNIEIFGLHEMIDELILSYAPIIEKKELNIFNNTKQDHKIKGEKFLIHHCFSNLLDNAIKFSFKNGNITIHSESNDRFLKIDFIDNGLGIPDYALDKIFDKFYSLPSPDNNKKSTGLGLTFVKETVLLHQGSIEVTNNPDKGVTSTILLPINLL